MGLGQCNNDSQDSNPSAHPTDFAPTSSPRSSATRRATDNAAKRRGWVTTSCATGKCNQQRYQQKPPNFATLSNSECCLTNYIHLMTPNEAGTTRAGGPAVPSTTNCPIWVVFPLPVSPWTKITWLEAKSFASSSFTSLENGCSCPLRPIHQRGQPSYIKRIYRRRFGFTISFICILLTTASGSQFISPSPWRLVELLWFFSSSGHAHSDRKSPWTHLLLSFGTVWLDSLPNCLDSLHLFATCATILS